MFEKWKRQIAENRGQLQCDPAKCTYCGICQRTCPEMAITVSAWAWDADDERCARCVQRCPSWALAIVKD